MTDTPWQAPTTATIQAPVTATQLGVEGRVSALETRVSALEAGGHTAPAPQAATPSTLTYVVRNGDTLESIATALGVTRDALYNRNHVMILAAAVARGMPDDMGGKALYPGETLDYEDPHVVSSGPAGAPSVHQPGQVLVRSADGSEAWADPAAPLLPGQTVVSPQPVSTPVEDETVS